MEVVQKEAKADKEGGAQLFRALKGEDKKLELDGWAAKELNFA